MSIAWVTTCEEVKILEVEKAKEQLLKEKVKELTFKVFIIGYNSHFYLIGEADRFVAANKLGITINLIQYDEKEYIHINEYDFIPEEAFELIDKDGFINIYHFYDRYNWEGDTCKVTVKCLEVFGIT